MTGWPIRFIHASDLHLEEPLQGVTEIPDSMRQMAVDAPYLALEKLVDAAIEAAVDFVIFAGDTIEPDLAGPRGILLLRDQLTRLTERRIAVFWYPGKIDPSGIMPPSMALPPGVEFFSGKSGEEILVHRDQEPIASLIGLGQDEETEIEVDRLRIRSNELFRIGVGYGKIDRTSLENSGFGYVALGGRHSREVLAGPPNGIQYSGTHQGRCPRETGRHGATIVDVDDLGKVRTKFLATDVLRWIDETVLIEEPATLELIQQRLSDALHAALQAADGRDLMVRWTVRTADDTARRLRRRHASDELLAWLRKTFAESSPAAWSVSLAIESGKPISEEWFDEETILGDYLRLARKHQKDEALAIDLSRYVGSEEPVMTIASAAKIKGRKKRRQVLGQAVQLGIDLLAGDRVAEQEGMGVSE